MSLIESQDEEESSKAAENTACKISEINFKSPLMIKQKESTDNVAKFIEISPDRNLEFNIFNNSVDTNQKLFNTQPNIRELTIPKKTERDELEMISDLKKKDDQM